MDEVLRPSPCLVCGRELAPIQHGDVQPVGALILSSSGHYGSDFDPMDGSVLQVNVCDPCLTARSVRVLRVRATVQTVTDWCPWNPEESDHG